MRSSAETERNRVRRTNSKEPHWHRGLTCTKMPWTSGRNKTRLGIVRGGWVYFAMWKGCEQWWTEGGGG